MEHATTTTLHIIGVEIFVKGSARLHIQVGLALTVGTQETE